MKTLDEQTLLDVFDGVPTFKIEKSKLETGVPFLDFLAVETKVFPSKGEARKMVQQGGVSVNKTKETDQTRNITTADLLNDKYLLVQKGKKNYYLVIAE